MRVISKSRLREFWVLPGHGEAEGPLRAWFTQVANKTVSWRSWADVKAYYPSASLVGDCIVFNVGGNKFRLIVRIRYATQKVFVLMVMTHREYDEGGWKGECGCFEAPPDQSRRNASRAGQPARGRRP